MQKRNPNRQLLSRDEFRERTFQRDQFLCAMCKKPAVDAHHILERRLFKAIHEKGGYFLDNGASLCAVHHLAAEQTSISCTEIRVRCGIEQAVLPAHFYPNFEYDKWGNVVWGNARLKGELYYEMSVQAILKEVPFLHYTLLPSLYYMPWSTSPKAGSCHSIGFVEAQNIVALALIEGIACRADRNDVWDADLHSLPSALQKKLLDKTEILDSEMYLDGVYSGSQFFLYEAWDKNLCLSWEDTQELSRFLELPMPDVLYQGEFDISKIRSLIHPIGYKLRLRSAFKAFDLFRSMAVVPH